MRKRLPETSTAKFMVPVCDGTKCLRIFMPGWLGDAYLMVLRDFWEEVGAMARARN